MNIQDQYLKETGDQPKQMITTNGGVCYTHDYVEWLEMKLRAAENKESPAIPQQPQHEISAIAETCDRYAKNCGLQSGMASAFEEIARRLRAMR